MRKKKILDCFCWKTMIEGIEFDFIELSSGWISATAPMGDTPEQKEMLDKLVYYNQEKYHGRKASEIKKKISNFIKQWKQNSNI